MQFIDAAKRVVSRSRKANSDPYALTLTFLLKNAVGRANAVSQATIVEFLRSRNISMTVTAFQQTVLKRSRGGAVFIASSPKGCFLIAKKVDAIAMRDFYQNRIEAETRNLERLKKLSCKKGWKI